MAESKDPSSNENSCDTSVGDDLVKSISNDIIDVLALDDNENKDAIVKELLENGRSALAKYKEDIISKTYKEVMDNNDSKLLIVLKRYFQQKWETQYGTSHQWFISFLQEYENGENHDIYEHVLTRTAEYGNRFMKNCPMLSLVLQLLFESIDDQCLKETNVFNDLWFTITNDGLKSITKYSDYIIKKVMNEQLKSQSILFQVLREYYRENVFLSLKQSNIVDKANLYELVLDNVAEDGWLTEVKSVEDSITPRSYKMLLEKLRSFHQKEKPPASDKAKVANVPPTKADVKPEPTSTEKDKKTKEKQKDDEEQKSLFHGMDAKEKEIFTLINNHRRQYGLPVLEPSVNLAYVAHTHAVDVVENNPDVRGGNAHSWSNKGKWKAVIYTPDHRNAQLMWSKPSEISNYKFTGFEISMCGSDSVRRTTTVNPTEAVNGWIHSSAHHDVIIQRGIFQSPPMKAMGVGVYKGYACVWFGQEKDTYPAPS